MEIRIAYSQRTEVEMLKKRREVFRMIALKCANFSIALAFTLCFASVLLAQPNKLYWSDAGTSLIQRSGTSNRIVYDPNWLEPAVDIATSPGSRAASLLIGVSDGQHPMGEKETADR